MHSQRVLRVAAAGVVGVDVDGLGQRALDDAPGAADEPLELRREHDRLLLVHAQLANWKRDTGLLQAFAGHS